MLLTTYALLSLSLVCAPQEWQSTKVDPRYRLLTEDSPIPFAGIRSLVELLDGALVISDRGGVVNGGRLLHLSADRLTATVLFDGLPLPDPDGLALAPSSSRQNSAILLTDHNAEIPGGCCDGVLVQVDLADIHAPEISVIVNGNPYRSVGDPTAVVPSKSGPLGDFLYVVDFQGSSSQIPSIFRVDGQGQTNNFIASNVWKTNSSPRDLDILPGRAWGNGLAVADFSDSSTEGIWLFDPAGRMAKLNVHPPLNRPSSLTFGKGGAWGDSLYVLDEGLNRMGRVLRIEADGSSKVILSGIADPNINPSQAIRGSIRFTNHGDRLFVGCQDTIWTLRPRKQFELVLNSSMTMEVSAISGDLGAQLASANSAPPVGLTWSAPLQDSDNDSLLDFSCLPITGFNEDLSVIRDSLPPANTSKSLEVNLYENNLLRIFWEDPPVIPTGSVAVDICSPGLYANSSDLVSCPNVEVVDVEAVALLHFDQPGNNGSTRTIRELEFAQSVLGIMILDASLSASDGTFGNSSTTYPTGFWKRGLELDNQEDSVELMSDGRTIKFDLLSSSRLDQIRVLLGNNSGNSALRVTTAPITGVDEVSMDVCQSAWYRLRFTLPAMFNGARISGTVNADDLAVLWLNGVQVSGSLTIPPTLPDPWNPWAPEWDLVDTGKDLFDSHGRRLITGHSSDWIATSRQAPLVPGLNELIFSVIGDASPFDPTGLEFKLLVIAGRD